MAALEARRALLLDVDGSLDPLRELGRTHALLGVGAVLRLAIVQLGHAVTGGCEQVRQDGRISEGDEPGRPV